MAVQATPPHADPAAETSSRSETPESGGAQTGANRADPTQPSGAAGEEQEQPKGPDYFRDAIYRLRGIPVPQAPTVSAGPKPETERSADRDEGSVQTSAEDAGAGHDPASAKPDGKQPPQSDVVTLTQAELDRRVQAEADRIMAKRQRDEQAKRQRDEEIELRRNNPIEYVRRLEEKEQEAQAAAQENTRLHGLLDSQVIDYDRNVLDLFVGALPKEIVPQVTNVQEPGIPGRAKIAQGALKALKEHYLAEGAKTARDRLLKDQAFVKEVLARFGGQHQEPDAPITPIPAASSAAPIPRNENDAVNAWMRSERTNARVTSGR